LKFLKIVSSIVFFGIILLSFLLYARINDTLPVYRGIIIEKNIFWATRIQFINLLTYFAILILGNSVLRYEEFKKSKVVAVSLILTVMCKSIIEFVSLFYNAWLNNSVAILVPTLIIGLSIALYHSKYILKSKRWKNIKFNFIEKIVLSIIGIAYIAINIPSLMYVMLNK